MRLQITNIPARIGINKNDAVLSIRQPKADLQIETEPAMLNMKQEHVRVKIDQSQCFSEAGLKGRAELSEEFAQLGRQAVLDGIARMVDEGNTMAAIANGQNAVANIAAAKVFRPPDDFNIDFIPKSRPRIEFEGGKVFFDPQPGKVNIRAKINPPEISATYPQLQFYTLQQHEFRMEFVGDRLDIRG